MNITWAAVLTTCRDEGCSDEALLDQTLERLVALGLPEKAVRHLRGIRNLNARTQSIAARLALIWALSGEGGVHPFDEPIPKQWQKTKPLSGLGYDEQGAPFLADRQTAISLSHCEALAVAACADQGRIGVDVEAWDRPLVRRDEIAKRFFSSAELTLWEQNGREPSDFVRIWTRKEALCKAKGIGLAPACELDTCAAKNAVFQDIALDGFVITVCQLNE